MKGTSYLIINPNGIKAVRKTKPYLEWNEIAIKVNLNIPDAMFHRPRLEATIKVDKMDTEHIDPMLIVNTKDLIKESTGARIDFRVVPYEEEEDE